MDTIVNSPSIGKRLPSLYHERLGRPAIDPEVMFRILLLDYLYGLSENRLFPELGMPLGDQWFCHLRPDDANPDRPPLNKLRTPWWAEAGIIEEFLGMIGQCCIDGEIGGWEASGDGLGLG